MGLALETMPRTAGVKRGGFIAALATAIQVSAERCRTAVLNGKENAEMQPGQLGTVPFAEAVAMCADDICPETQVRLRASSTASTRAMRRAVLDSAVRRGRGGPYPDGYE
jgi:hypothetical protein